MTHLRKGDDAVTNATQDKPINLNLAIYLIIATGVAIPFLGFLTAGVVYREFYIIKTLSLLLADIQKYPKSWIFDVTTAAIPFIFLGGTLHRNVLEGRIINKTSIATSIISFLLVIALGLVIHSGYQASRYDRGPGASTSGIAIGLFAGYGSSIVLILDIAGKILAHWIGKAQGRLKRNRDNK